MLHKDQLRKQVIQYFRTVGSGENILQCIKEALFLHQKFNPVLLFEILSKGKQKITSNDWRNYLLKHNINFNDEEFKYFSHQNQYKNQIILNEFLQSMIPYNADVVRQFKQKYLDSIEIRQFDPEVQFIFVELLDNQFKFYRTLINVRQDITKIATLKQVQTIVKEDLVTKSKPRQGRKFHQSFQQKGFELGFHQLRKFLQLWLSQKQILHQFYMLNIIRHLKSDNPFCKLIYKSKRGRSKIVNNNQESSQKRPFSAKQRSGDNSEVRLTNQKIKQKFGNFQDKLYESSYGKSWGTSGKKDKYLNFKDQMIAEYIQNKKNTLTNFHPTIQQKQPKIPYEEMEVLKRSRQLRQSRGIDGTYAIKFLQQIIKKEERLQKLRKNLAKHQDFNLINLFKLLDSKNKGYVMARDISDWTLIGKVQFNHLVNFYARQVDILRFHEFCLIFRPLSKQLNESIDSRPQHKVPNPFKSQTTKLILEILTVTAQLHINLNKLREKVANQGINTSYLFAYLDLNQNGYLDNTTIENILKQNSIFCDDKDMKCLMKLFRKKITQRISKAEFIDFISL